LDDLEEGGSIQIDILSFAGKILASRNFNRLPSIPGGNNTIFEVMFSDSLTVDRLKHYVRARFTPSSFQLSNITRDAYMFYFKPRDLRIPVPDIIAEKDYANNEITFSTTNFVMYLYIYVCGHSDHTLKLSNNYFHLSPGWKVKVKVLNKDEDHRLRNMRLCYKNVRDTYAANLINP